MMYSDSTESGSRRKEETNNEECISLNSIASRFCLNNGDIFMKNTKILFKIIFLACAFFSVFGCMKETEDKTMQVIALSRSVETPGESSSTDVSAHDFVLKSTETLSNIVKIKGTSRTFTHKYFVYRCSKCGVSYDTRYDIDFFSDYKTVGYANATAAQLNVIKRNSYRSTSKNAIGSICR